MGLICPHCGNIDNFGSRPCVKCGEPLYVEKKGK